MESDKLAVSDTIIERKLEVLIDGQRKQAENDKTVLAEVEALRKSFEKLREKFDDIHEKEIVHDQKIKVLEKSQVKSETNCKEQRELIWTKIRTSKTEAISTAVRSVKIWVFGAMVTALGSSVLMVITYIIKK